MTHTGELLSAGGDQQFEYDALDRLTKFTGNNTTEQYAYDLTGNRTQLILGGASYGNTINTTSNRLSSTLGPLPAKTNTFDAAGNLTNDGSIGFTYSDRGRLKSVLKAGVSTSYLYNAIDQRVVKMGPGVETGANHYAYDESGRLLGEYKADGSVIQETVYLDDQPVAVLAGEIYYVYADHIQQHASSPVPAITASCGVGIGPTRSAHICPSSLMAQTASPIILDFLGNCLTRRVIFTTTTTGITIRRPAGISSLIRSGSKVESTPMAMLAAIR